MTNLSKSKLIVTAAALVFGAASGHAQGWDGAKLGKITGLDVSTDGGNYGVRVFMDGAPMCGSGTVEWAYINKSADNYEVVVSLLASAYLSNKTVAIYTTARGQYCEIGYALFR